MKADKELVLRAAERNWGNFSSMFLQEYVQIVALRSEQVQSELRTAIADKLSLFELEKLIEGLNLDDLELAVEVALSAMAELAHRAGDTENREQLYASYEAKDLFRRFDRSDVEQVLALRSK